jgi:RNA polymerase sigma-70 factor (ECF subfamily)
LERRLEHLLAVHGASLGRVAASYARDASDRDDLFQEIVIAVWRALPNFRGECSDRTFVFRIAHNRGITHSARRPASAATLSEDADVIDGAPTPEQSLASLEEGRRLLAAVQRLTIGYRQVVTLSLEGLSYAEIADVLGISESNVGARLTRARHALRQELERT